MNSISNHDFRSRLTKELSKTAGTNTESVLQIMKDLLQVAQGQVVSSQHVSTLVTQLTYIKDIRVKKLVYLYLSFVDDREPDMWLQVTNSIANDLIDPSSSVRKAALLFLTDSQSVSTSINDIRVSNIVDCLRDINPAVRCHAVAGTAKLFMLFEKKNERCDMTSVFRYISNMIYSDDDPAVITECLRCLQCCGKGIVKTELLLSLLERLDLVEDWIKTGIVNLFTRYSDPSKMTHEEIFQVLNHIDPYLDQKYPTFLVFSSITAMLHVSGQFKNINSDVTSRILKFLLSEVNLFRQDAQCVYLAVLSMATTRHAISELVPHYKSFLLLPSDTAFLKFLKLKLLQKVCVQENSAIILQQVISCSMTAKENELIVLAIETMYYVHKYMPSQCFSLLHKLLMHDNVAVTDASVVLLKQIISLHPHKEKMDVVDKLIPIYEKISSDEAKIAYFWLVLEEPEQRHMKQLYNIMDREESNWSSVKSISFKLILLKSAMVSYFASPRRFQKLLGKFLQDAALEENITLKRQAVLYYNLLKHDTKAAKAVVTYKKSDGSYQVAPHKTLVQQGLNLLTCGTNC